MSKKVLIYDGECAYCRGFARLVRFLDRRKEVVAVPFESPEAQALLRGQFGDKYGFAMYFFEHDRVNWGAEAAKRTAESVALPHWMGKFVFHAYPELAKVVSKLTHRRGTVCGLDCVGLKRPSPNSSL